MASRGRRKSVGVVEMARDLGVSTATISRALNGSPSVRQEFADRVRAHAEMRGYVANRLARALLRGLVATRIAGLVISPSTHVLDDTRRLLAEFPVVELHRVSGIDAPGVFGDGEQALTDSILHLAELGHTEIAYLGTPREMSNGATRLRGIRRGVAVVGLDPRRITFRLVAGSTGAPPGRRP